MLTFLMFRVGNPEDGCSGYKPELLPNSTLFCFLVVSSKLLKMNGLTISIEVEEKKMPLN